MTSNPYARGVVTSSDFSPIVGVINWIMMVSTVLSVCARMGMKLFVSRVLNSDDFVISCAMVFSVAQSISLAVQNGNGIGQHQNSLSQAKIRKYEKAAYSSDLLFITNLALSKISVFLLLRQITPIVTHRRAALGTIILVASWAIVSLFASALQCAVPNTWEILGSRCFNQLAFWTFFGVMNILSEVLVIGLSIYFLWGVQISRKSRWTIIACFAIRLSIVGAVIAQLVFLHRTSGSSDRTFEGWPYELSKLFVQNLSVITACVPFVKNFMLGLESGMIRIDDQERRRKMSTAAYLSGSSNQGAQYSNRKPSAGAVAAAANRSKKGGQEDLDLELRDIDNMPLTAMRPEPINNTTTIQTATRRPDDGSQTSDEGQIRATTEIIVNHSL